VIKKVINGYNMSKSIFKILALAVTVLAFSSCDTGVRVLGSSEYGVKFSKLPPSIGGLPSPKDIVQRGQMVIVWPWNKLYTFDTKKKIIEWGAQSKGSDKANADYVQTRAIDGNEVSLAVRVEYRISSDPEQLLNLVKNVATTEEEVREIVIAVARADIRTAMNELKTNEFFDNDKKFAGQEKIKQRMSLRLNKYGIIIESVNLEEHRFERVGLDGSVDRSYQEKINEVQTLDEQRKREESRIATIKAQKDRELNDIQSDMNRKIEQAKGYLRQAKMRADAYYKIKDNESQRIIETGKSEIEGLQETINAYKGAGGEAILKIELVKQLLKNNPKFVLMGDNATGNGVDVKRVDTNALLDQIGVFEGLKDNKAKDSVPAKIANPESNTQQTK
jgi:hypothetical protein